MKRSICIVFLLLLLCFGAYIIGSKSNDVTYTRDELNKMSAVELYNLFLENGLEVDKDLQDTVSKDKLAKLFKSEFDLFSKGISSLGDMRYMKLAESTKIIYDRITR